MNAVESYQHLVLRERQPDYIPGIPSPRYNVQKFFGNERKLCDFFTNHLGKEVVELANPDLGLCDTRLDAGTRCGSDVFEFKTCRHHLWKFDHGCHGGVAVQAHKIDGLRNACGLGSWKFEDGLTPFRRGWYVYWDLHKRIWALTLDEIVELIVGQEPKTIKGNDGPPSYSIKSKHWKQVGVMPTEPVFEIK